MSYVEKNTYLPTSLLTHAISQTPSRLPFLEYTSPYLLIYQITQSISLFPSSAALHTPNHDLQPEISVALGDVSNLVTVAYTAFGKVHSFSIAMPPSRTCACVPPLAGGGAPPPARPPPRTGTGETERTGGRGWVPTIAPPPPPPFLSSLPRRSLFR